MVQQNKEQIKRKLYRLMGWFENISCAVGLSKEVLYACISWIWEKNRLGPACETQLIGCHYVFFWLIISSQTIHA
jgi:hypothetical protein